jgi:NADH-quinone oxidoreductase subunit J
VVGIGMLALLVAAVYSGSDEVVVRGEGIASTVAGDNPNANVEQLAKSIFSDYVVAFELTSILLVVAVVGTVLLARRRRGEVKAEQ